MGIEPTFTMADIAEEIRLFEERVEQAIIRRLHRLGEECVNLARTNGEYLNQTGNLRNSIGYVIFDKGELVDENFKHVVTGKDSTDVDPIKVAKTYAMEVAGGITRFDNYVLVVVAGMNYASHVENMGRDVLTSAEQYAAVRLPVMLDQLRNNIESTLL